MLQTRCKASNIHIAPVEKCCLLIPEIKNTNYWICLSLSRTPNHDSFDTKNMYLFVFFYLHLLVYIHGEHEGRSVGIKILTPVNYIWNTVIANKAKLC